MNETKVSFRARAATEDAHQSSPLRKTTRELFEPMIWAIDLREARVPTLQSQLKSIRKVLGVDQPQILPATVVYPVDFGLSAGWPEPADRTVSRLQTYFSERLAPLGLPVQPHLITEESDSLRKAVHTLIKYAKREKAGAVVVGTHGRKGFQRFRLGSFAEALIGASTVPVLVLPQRAHSRHKQARILFATDFSEGSRRAFRSIVELAKRSKARIDLLHVFSLRTDALAMNDLGMGVDALWIDELWRQTEFTRKRSGEEMAQVAKAAGVECEFVLKYRDGRLGSQIAKVAKARKCTLIALGTGTHLDQRFHWGSSVRDVLLETNCPVLVTPHELRKNSKSPQSQNQRRMK